MLPLSFHCGGLYKTLKHYDFVGYMDENYYQHLNRFAEWYPPSQKYLDFVFDLKAKQNVTNEGTEQQASKHTMSFYNAHTVKRVLEYFAIDYVMLDLPIPNWAQDILAADQDSLYHTLTTT